MARTINPGLGTLGALPREIRDEIYRNLVVGDYTMSSWVSVYRFELEGLLMTDTSVEGFAIFCVQIHSR